jgi:hypothetical protein
LLLKIRRRRHHPFGDPEQARFARGPERVAHQFGETGVGG